MKEINREKMRSIHVELEDTIALRCDSEEIMKEEIGREMDLDEAVIFLVEEGDFEGADGGVGGAFLSSKKEGKC